jgi:iron complex transport system substrate-binding protein
MNPVVRVVTMLLMVVLVAGLVVVGFLSAGFQPQPGTEEDRQGEYQRVVSLAPSITETLFAIGAGERVVGVSTYCEYPPEVQDLPEVGALFDTNYEAIARLEPDLVVVTDNSEDAPARLKQMGIDSLMLGTHSIDDIESNALDLGEALGRQDAAIALAERIHNEVETVRTAVAGEERPRVLITVASGVPEDRPNDVYVVGPGNVYNELLDIAGATNAYEGDLSSAVVSLEGLYDIDPDIIIEIAEDTTDSVAMRDWWRNHDRLKAVQNNRVYILDDDYALIPGPRVVELLIDFANRIHPGRLGDA